MLGWHFVDKRLRDGRPVPADGEWLVHEGLIEPCEAGLHMSVCPFDALQYAPGSTLCLVELDGEIVGHGNPVDKYVGRRRRIVARIDATHLLRRFAADQSLSVAHLLDMPAIVQEYLETLDESKRAAAWDMARSAAAFAARNAAEVAAWDAVEAAARNAVEVAARAAVWNAVEVAARVAARAAARKEFVKRVHFAFGINE